VAEPSAAVADTHALLYHAGRDRRLGRRAAALFAACEARAAIIYIPVVTLWETGLLARRGRVRLGRPLRAFTDDLFSNPAYQPFNLSPEQALLAEEHRLNDDPFDALIVSAARLLDLPLMTRDADIVRSKLVEILW
jgi:PIN domain nuclease of toxin-antitoxin system